MGRSWACGPYPLRPGWPLRFWPAPTVRSGLPGQERHHTPVRNVKEAHEAGRQEHDDDKPWHMAPAWCGTPPLRRRQAGGRWRSKEEVATNDCRQPSVRTLITTAVATVCAHRRRAGWSSRPARPVILQTPLSNVAANTPITSTPASSRAVTLRSARGPDIAFIQRRRGSPRHRAPSGRAARPLLRSRQQAHRQGQEPRHPLTKRSAQAATRSGRSTRPTAGPSSPATRPACRLNLKWHNVDNVGHRARRARPAGRRHAHQRQLWAQRPEGGSGRGPRAWPSPTRGAAPSAMGESSRGAVGPGPAHQRPDPGQPADVQLRALGRRPSIRPQVPVGQLDRHGVRRGSTFALA